MQLQHEGHTRPNSALSTPAPVGAGAGGRRDAYPDPRTILRALDVVLRLPTEAIADLTERLVDLLDAIEPDADLEPETDACDAGECGGLQMATDKLPGDSTDAESDEDDRGEGEDEPRFPDSLRSARDGVAQVRRQTIMAIVRRRGRPTRTLRMRHIRWEASR